MGGGAAEGILDWYWLVTVGSGSGGQRFRALAILPSLFLKTGI